MLFEGRDLGKDLVFKVCLFASLWNILKVM